MNKNNGRIKNPVRLKFDPMDGRSVNDLTRRICRNDISRTLWMAIKSTHKKTNKKYFGENCIAVADYIELHEIPKSPEELKDITDEYILDEKGRKSDYSIAFLTELYPYLFGNKKLRYLVRGKDY